MDIEFFKNLVVDLISPLTPDDKRQDLLMFCYHQMNTFLYLMLTEFDRPQVNQDIRNDVINNLETIKYKIENEIEKVKND